MKLEDSSFKSNLFYLKIWWFHDGDVLKSIVFTQNAQVWSVNVSWSTIPVFDKTFGIFFL